MNPLRTLLGGVVDYAGLFPPAGLDMATAVRNYASYKKSVHEWMLGKFIVPASRLAEFSLSAQALPQDGAPWYLSALAGPDFELSAKDILDFNRRNSTGPFHVASIEARASTIPEITRIALQRPEGMALYVEIPLRPDPQQLLSALAASGLYAKVRTGGTSAEMFPATADLARFIDECVKTGVLFKATAGLHHPIRSTYRLTYAPDSLSGVMFGFLNVFLAAAFAKKGMDMRELTVVLEEGRAGAFMFGDGGVQWKEYRLTNDDLAAARATAVTAFGSCSFREPVDELTALGLL